MADERIVDAYAILSKWHELLKARFPNFPCQTLPAFIRNNSQELVRCKDCVCSSTCDDQLICSRIADVMDGYYRGTAEVVKPDDYCSHEYARRRSRWTEVRMFEEIIVGVFCAMMAFLLGCAGAWLLKMLKEKSRR